MKKRIKQRVLYALCIILFLGIVAFLACYLLDRQDRGKVYEEMQEDNKEHEQEVKEEIVSENKVEIPIDFARLKQKNGHIYAWIRIPGTVVDYPIVQHPSDNSYYLNRTVEGKKGLPGSIYTETHNTTDFTDRNTLIYGHNMKGGSMFGGLKQYKNSNYMREHSQILIYTPEHIYTYQVFGAITYDDRHIMYAFDFSTEQGLQAYLDSIRSVRNMATYIDKSVEVTAEDKIITLSTCTGDETKRFLIEAVLVNVQ